MVGFCARSSSTPASRKLLSHLSQARKSRRLRSSELTRESKMDPVSHGALSRPDEPSSGTARSRLSRQALGSVERASPSARTPSPTTETGSLFHLRQTRSSPPPAADEQSYAANHHPDGPRTQSPPRTTYGRETHTSAAEKKRICLAAGTPARESCSDPFPGSTAAVRCLRREGYATASPLASSVEKWATLFTRWGSQSSCEKRAGKYDGSKTGVLMLLLLLLLLVSRWVWVDRRRNAVDRVRWSSAACHWLLQNYLLLLQHT